MKKENQKIKSNYETKINAVNNSYFDSLGLRIKEYLKTTIKRLLVLINIYTFR